MSRCNTIVAAALAAAALPASGAFAQSGELYASTALAAAAQRLEPASHSRNGTGAPGPKQDLRSPDTRDAANGRTTANVPEIAVIRVPAPAPATGNGGGVAAGGLLLASVLAAGGTAAVIRRRQSTAA